MTSSSASVAIVMTTIFDPRSLESYARNAAKFGHTERTNVIVIGDVKVHPDALATIQRVDDQYPGFVDWWDIERQRSWIAQFSPRIGSDIPERSDNRRNLGYLIALQSGADVIVSVDDDNYPIDDVDFVGGHSSCGTHHSGDVMTDGGWFNIMSMLEGTPTVAMWPRGFPFKHRNALNPAPEMPTSPLDLTIGLNAGLWLGDPDIDAITRLAIGPDITAITSSCCVLKDTFTPINSQNTSVVRDLLPAYYYFRQNEHLYSWPVNRFGDIWQGLVVQAVAYAAGYGLRVGTPEVRQLRNEHDLLIDLRQELPGILVNEWLADYIAEFQFASQAVSENVVSLLEGIVADIPSDGFFPDDVRPYFERISATYHKWIYTCEALAK